MARRNRPNLYRMLAARQQPCPGGTIPCPDGSCAQHVWECGPYLRAPNAPIVLPALQQARHTGATTRNAFTTGQRQGVVCIETSDPDWLVCIYCSKSTDFPYGPTCIYYPWKWPENRPGTSLTAARRQQLVSDALARLRTTRPQIYNRFLARGENPAGASAVAFVQALQQQGSCGVVKPAVGSAAAPVGIGG